MKRQSIDRAVAIVQHLQSTLDMDQGKEVAADLDRLYTYITSRIRDASGKLEVAPLEEAAKLLTVLLSGWGGVARKEHEHAGPARQQRARPPSHVLGDDGVGAMKHDDGERGQGPPRIQRPVAVAGRARRVGRHGAGARSSTCDPITSTSMCVRRKQSSASFGCRTIGSFSLNEVLSSMGTPLIRSNAVIRLQ